MSASQKAFNKALNGYIFEQKKVLIDDFQGFLKEKLPDNDDKIDEIIDKFKEIHVSIHKDEKIKNEKTPRKKTAYNNYIRVKLAELKKNSSDNVDYRKNFSTASKGWKNLSESEKKKFEP